MTYYLRKFLSSVDSVTVNGAKVGRLPQSELSNNALLASIKGKVKNNPRCLIGEIKQ